MAPLKKAILYIDADVDGDGTAENGKFVMESVEPTIGIRTGYLIGGRGSTANAVLDDLLGDGESRQQGVFLGFGGGTRKYDLSFSGWEGSGDQWGDTGNGGTASDATGEDPWTQIDVLIQYLSVASVDSTGLATLEYGEHHPNGRFDSVGVVPEQPQFTPPLDESSTFTGSMTLLSAANLTKALDGQKQTPD